MNTRGFTLIETLIYVALFAMIMTMGMLSVYQLLQGSAQATAKATVQDEENFVLRKIDWALSGVSTVSVSPSTLTVTRYDGNTVNFQLIGGAVHIKENSNGLGYLPITTNNVTVSALTFASVAPIGTGPAGVTATLTISGNTLSTTKYIRK